MKYNIKLDILEKIIKELKAYKEYCNSNCKAITFESIIQIIEKYKK